MNTDIAYEIGRCFKWNELNLRNQTVYLYALNTSRYEPVAIWYDARLVRHTRSKALWLVRGDTATVVKPNKDTRALLALWN